MSLNILKQVMEAGDGTAQCHKRQEQQTPGLAILFLVDWSAKSRGEFPPHHKEPTFKRKVPCRFHRCSDLRIWAPVRFEFIQTNPYSLRVSTKLVCVFARIDSKIYVVRIIQYMTILHVWLLAIWHICALNTLPSVLEEGLPYIPNKTPLI